MNDLTKKPSLGRKRTRAFNSNANGGPRAKKSKSTPSYILKSYKNLPDINEIPKAKSEPLDVFVWGTGSMCELGLGPNHSTKEVKRPRLNPFLSKEKVAIVDFAVGGMHTLALDDKNQIWSWGSNDSGVLGRDTSASANENLKDMDAESDDEDGDLNEAESTPKLVENLPKTDSKIIQVAATDNLSAALYDNGDVYAWGTFRCNEGTLGFMKDNKKQTTPLKIEQFVNIVQLASGKDHLLGLDTKGIVFAWGNGQQYQLGRRILERTRLKTLEPKEFGLHNIKFIGSGEFHCFAIDHNDKVYAWGLNQFGQCGIDTDIEDGAVISKPTEIEALSDKKIVNITGGEHHSLALTESGDVYAFGRYDMKEVGIPEAELPEETVKDPQGRPRCVPVPTKLSKLQPVKEIACGSHHSLVATQDGVVFAWGFADTYAVGLGILDDDVPKPTRIENTATKNHKITIIGAGGQFSVSGGSKLSDDEAEERLEKYEDLED